MPRHVTAIRARRSIKIFALLVAAGVADSLGESAWAQTSHTWTGGSTLTTGGVWNLAGNWNPAGVPTTGDFAILHGNSSTADTTVTYDYTGPAVTLGGVTVSQANPFLPHFSVLSMSANNLTANTEAVADTSGGGSKGRGLINQSGGVNTASVLFLAGNSTDLGSYALSGTGALHVGTFNVGVSGTGNVTQSGGSAQASLLDLGSFSGSRGTYTLSSGNLGVSGRAIVGDGGNGTFDESGGSAGLVSTGSVAIGVSGAGTYLLSGAHLDASGLTLGAAAAGAGSFSLSNAGTLTAHGEESIGYSGSGVFNQTSGLNSIIFINDPNGNHSAVTLGGSAGASGAYLLNDGTLRVVNARQIVGLLGTGTFTQSGGTHEISFTGPSSANWLMLGAGTGSSGVYTLSDGTLVVTNVNEYVGNYGAGTFTQSGGTHTMSGSGYLSIAGISGSTGAYNLNGGTLSTTNIYVGGEDIFAGGAGSLIVASGASLTVGGTLKAWSAGSVSLASPTRVGAVATAGNGKIDLTNSAMVVDYAPGPSPLTSIGALLTAGYAGGAWTGPGINSSTAALPANLNKTALGFAEAASIFTSFPATFAGLTVDDSSVLIRYTLYGDANLDGSVNTVDFNLLVASFGQSGKSWVNGDFSYDSTVDTVDFNRLVSNLRSHCPPCRLKPARRRAR